MSIYRYIAISFMILTITNCSQIQQSHDRVESDYNEGFRIINDEDPNNNNGQTQSQGGISSNTDCKQPSTQRSYVVHGKRYYPIEVKAGDEFHGIASWYGPTFNAKKTSNGEIYDMYKNTAASKTLPMNTMVKVLNKSNNKTVVVRINDRGPFVTGRIIDLSNKAARTIAMHNKGIADVKVVVISAPDICGNKTPVTIPDDKQYEDISIPTQPTNNSTSIYVVQIASFLNYDKAIKYKNKAQSNVSDYETKIVSKEIDGQVYNRVIFTGFGSEDEARRFKENQYPDGLVIQNQ